MREREAGEEEEREEREAGAAQHKQLQGWARECELQVAMPDSRPRRRQVDHSGNEPSKAALCKRARLRAKDATDGNREVQMERDGDRERKAQWQTDTRYTEIYGNRDGGMRTERKALFTDNSDILQRDTPEFEILFLLDLHPHEPSAYERL
eukprot:3443360-Rhodomonas_salina.1